MAGDVSVLLDLDAKQLYNELQQVQNHIVSFAKHSEDAGGKAGHGFVSSLKNAFSGIGDVLGNVKNAITSTAGLFGIGIGVGAGIAEIKSVIEFGAHIEDLSRKTGVNAEILSRWGFAAQKTGTDIEGLSKFIGFLEINREKAARGDTEKIHAFERLGSTAERVKDPLLSIDGILNDIAKGNTNPLDLKAVGGKGSTEVIELLRGVGDGILKLDKALSELDVRKLKEIQLAFTDLTNSITVALAPAIVQVFRSLEDHADTFVTHLKEAAVQLTALHDAAKTKTPGAFFEALGKGQDETKKLEQDLSNRQTEREKKRIEEEAESKKPKTDKHSLLTDDADDIAEGKQAKKDAKAEAKADKEAAKEEKAEEREEKKEQTEQKKEIKEEARDERDTVKDAAEQRKFAKKEEKLDQNPTGLSLQDYATSPYLNSQTAAAKQALNEEKTARDLQLRGLGGDAAAHQNRAEEIKKSLGLPNKLDQKEAMRDALNDSQVLKDIRDHTKEMTANV